MTPPNELEKLAEFQDAIQSNKGLERLRAMQYLQQMNNQGIMGLPQVQQQPIVQRENGGVTMPEPYYDLDTALKNTEVGEYFVLGQGVNQKLYKVGVGNNGEKIYNEEIVTDELKEKLFNVENSPDYTTAPTYIGETTTLVGGIDAYTAEDIKDGTVSEEEAIAYNNRLRNLEQSNQNRPQYNRRIDVEKHGDMGVQFRAYGGAIGTGGLVGRTDNGLGIWNRTEEGTMNKGIYGGIYEGDSESTSTSPSSTSATPGTLASGITAPSEFTIQTGQDKYGNTIGDTKGIQDYYDLNYAAQDAGQDTFMYGDKLMQVDGGYLRGYPFNPFISNKMVEDQIINPHLYSSYQSGNAHAYNINNPRKPDIFKESFYNLPSSNPTGEFAQDVSGSYSYYDANKAAQEAGSPTFMYGDKLMQVDGGYLQGGPINPFISNKVPENWTTAGVQMGSPHVSGINLNSSPRQIMKAQPNAPIGLNWDDKGRRYQDLGYGVKKYFAGGGQITAREGGGLIDLPIRGASRLADEVNYVEEVDPINLPQPIMANQGGYVLDLASGGPIDPAEAAQGLASFGRHGDSMLIHMNPEEVQGLMSLGKLTRNPITGLPEAFSFGNIFKGIKNIGKGLVKGVKKVVRSKTFKALAPLVLAVAAPYALGSMFPATFGAGAGALSTSSALGYGVATGLGSLVGNLLGGAKFGDAAKQGLLSGATAGIFKGIGSGNWMGPGTGGNVASGLSKVKQINTPKTLLEAGTATNVAAAPITGGNPFANQMAIRSAPIGENILTNVNAVPPNVGMSPDAYTGSGLQANQMMATTPGAVETVVPNQFSNVQFAPNVDVGVPPAPDATRESLFNSRLSNTGGSPAPGTGSTWDQVKQVGQDIYKDYGNWQGAAKLVGMDLMQPDWDQVYASEASMEDQLQDMGYTIDTGFDGQKVIRDSSGTVMPSSLSIQDILDRALGRTPRTRLADKIGFEPNATAFSAQGGLVSLAGGGEFSGMVEGDGHGMEDNVYMPIKERGHGKQIGTLAVSPSEYVVDAHTMSALGNGNPDAGAKVMDNVIAGVRKKAYGTTQQPNEINGLNALMPMMQGV